MNTLVKVSNNLSSVDSSDFHHGFVRWMSNFSGFEKDFLLSWWCDDTPIWFNLCTHIVFVQLYSRYWDVYAKQKPPCKNPYILFGIFQRTRLHQLTSYRFGYFWFRFSSAKCKNSVLLFSHILCMVCVKAITISARIHCNHNLCRKVAAAAASAVVPAISWTRFKSRWIINDNRWIQRNTVTYQCTYLRIHFPKYNSN